MMKTDKFFELNKRLLLLLILFFFFGLAWINRFIQDDALISFRYAENFANGEGLVFNEGEKVEGYTNFLWVIMESVFFKLNLPIVPSVHILSIIFFIGSLLFVYLLVDKLINYPLFSLFTILLVGVNPSFLAYGTGGLETQLQAFLILVSFYLYTKIYQAQQSPNKNFFLLGVIFTLLLLNRLDSAILILLMSFALVSFHLSRKDRSGLNKIFVTYFLPILITVCWFLWKQSYYGNVLPNTFYVKAVSNDILFLVIRGAFFVMLFVGLHFFLPITYLFFLKWKLIFGNIKEVFSFSPINIMTGYVFLHVLYIIKVGGGFMEFRYFIQITPLIYILLLTFIVLYMKKNTAYICIFLLFVNPIIGKAVMPNYIFGIESIENLSNHLYNENEDWVTIGKKLNTYFGTDSNVTIGVNPAGAIPFYSKLKSIDMLGLNDKWIAINGLPYRRTPGHFKITSLDYLLERKVNIVIGKPIMVNNNFLEIERDKYSLAYLKKILPTIDIESFSAPQYILEIPISKNYTLVTWYLIKNPVIDNLISQNKWHSGVVY
ncbi:hypothetical protein [Chondrinema litorale]|uniref:hypothetical protein n=1 Tax=Chondrinema litorale TaxID=2994555 RepID=UPI002542F53D|nr:hypothetical protein [Chondrinema litorale]UZS00146.1 hypothetical protein OQ292_40010 [Chondrinema litorale]